MTYDEGNKSIIITDHLYGLIRIWSLLDIRVSYLHMFRLDWCPIRHNSIVYNIHFIDVHRINDNKT